MIKKIFGTIFFFLGVAFFCVSSFVHAETYLTYISDLLSTSAPSASANHTIRFTLTQAIPANGAIELNFNEGGFTIPATVNFTDVDVSFSAVRGGPYTERPLSSVQTGGTDDITVTSGSNGKIRIDLNTSIGIPANNEVHIEIGTHARYGAIGDAQIALSAATGTYPVTIRTFNTADVELDYGRTVIVIVPQVTAGPVDTTDQIPPVILEAIPTGILQVGTRAVELYVRTDEYSYCRFATSSMAFAVMPYSFFGTSTGMALRHFAQVTGLEDDTEYTYYIRCQDFRLNEIDPDYELYFRVGILPGSATSTATTTGTGTGTGAASTTILTGPGTGDDIGTGGGPTGTGDGNSVDGGDGSGSGSGGSGSGVSGEMLPQAAVRIDGWAYPNSTVYIMMDGVVKNSKTAGTGGIFSDLIEGLDRGSYTFSVYAVDSKGVRGATYSSTMWVRAETLNVLSNVMLPPTLHVTEVSVSPGDVLQMSGYSASNARIMTWLRPKLAEVSSADVIATSTANANGLWSLSVPTAGLPQGTYELVAQSKTQDGLVESDKSARKTIGIGVTVSDDSCSSNGDLNCDGFVNLVDFSILLFNWNTASEVADINKDGSVSLPDFSIMLFNWTG
jgi:hypothetical protein